MQSHSRPSSEQRCEITDLIVDQCAHCQKHELGDEKPDIIFFGGLLK